VEPDALAEDELVDETGPGTRSSDSARLGVMRFARIGFTTASADA